MALSDPRRAVAGRSPVAAHSAPALAVAQRTWLCAAAVAALVVLAAVVPYANAFPDVFLFDDEPDIAQNPLVTGRLDVVRILATPLSPGDLYRPLTVLSLAINHAVAPQARMFHAVNVVLHAGVALLVFLLAVALSRSVRIAGLAAILFAVHPVHTEAVDALVGRAELLAALFGLLALLCAGWALDRRPAVRAVLEGLSLASFLLALLSKESALTLVPLIILYRIALREETLLHGLRRELAGGQWIPYALCAGAFVTLRCAVVWRTPTTYHLLPLNNVLGFVPWTVRVRTAVAILWDYCGLLIVPLVLSADYSYNQVALAEGWLDPRWLAGAALVAAALVAGIRHRRAAVRFAALFPFVTLAVTANVVFAIGTVKAERLLYFPSIGWVVLAAYAADRLWSQPHRRMLAGVLAAGVIGAYAGRTWVRNRDWRDDVAFYEKMVHTAPLSAKAHYNLGITYIRHRDYAPAIRELQRALAVYPLAEAALAIGSVFDERGQLDEASAWYARAHDIAPASGAITARLCAALLHSRQYARAAAACRHGLRYQPADSELLQNLGWSLQGEGARDGMAVLRDALALAPNDRELRRALAGMDADAPVSRRDARRGGP